jgi:hypothetical protein
MKPFRCAASAAVLGLRTLLAAPAAAQGVDDFGAYGGLERSGHTESRQDAAFELRFGRYQPEVDDEFGSGTTPFRDVFGNSTRFALGFEVDWQLLRIAHFGSIGPGVGWHLTRFGGTATVTATGEPSEEETTLWIMPMHLVGVLRVDVLAQDLGIPLVPYGKLGFGYGWWWSSDGDRTARFEGDSARGASYGLTYALGAMFLLDVLDREDAAMADAMSGINNSYVFAEWYRPQLDGFGAEDQLNIGSSSWLIGIAIEL